jgi:hypothetical protein
LPLYLQTDSFRPLIDEAIAAAALVESPSAQHATLVDAAAALARELQAEERRRAALVAMPLTPRSLVASVGAATVAGGGAGGVVGFASVAAAVSTLGVLPAAEHESLSAMAKAKAEEAPPPMRISAALAAELAAVDARLCADKRTIHDRDEF